MTRPRTPARHLSTQDQIAATLRDAGGPVTVNELSDMKAGAQLWFLKRTSQQAPFGSPWHGSEHFHECHDAGCIKSSHGAVSQADMQGLARQGLAERTKVGRRVFWSWTGPAVDMSAFEEQMAL